MPNDTENKPAEAAPQNVVTERVVTREVKEVPLGPNMTTDPPNPADHYFVNTNGDHINAFGEVKGSPEDKKRFS